MRLPAAALGLAFALTTPASRAEAFRDAPVGVVLRNRDLPSIDGKPTPLLGSAKANVFVFVRTAQDHSEQVLKQLATLAEEVKGKPVRFVAIVSGDERPDEVRALAKDTGISFPVLVDAGDAFYGEVGVSLHPSVGIADAEHRLVGYQPFRKLNFLDAMRGRVKLALGEIQESELAAYLDPPAAPTKANRALARMNLARKLLAANAVDAAIQSARAAVAMEPSDADAHALLAEALARAGSCPEAAREAEEARRLDPAVKLAPGECSPAR